MLQYSSTETYRNTGYRAAAISGSTDGREDLITAHLPKVKYIADRMAAKLPPSVEREDLYGAGVVGLIDAVERFDSTLGVAFTTFAELRVCGAILDNLRSLDWATRSARRRSREVQAAYSLIEQENGRAAGEEEVAAQMNIPLNKLYTTLRDMHGLTITNLDEPDESSGLTAADLVCDTARSPFQNYEASELRNALSDAIDKLPERKRKIVALYYLEELTMKEIGEVLSVTESRVSQMHTQAIVHLRANLHRGVNKYLPTESKGMAYNRNL